MSNSWLIKVEAFQICAGIEVFLMLLSFRRIIIIMGSVCSSNKNAVIEGKSLGSKGKKLKKEKSFVKQKGDSYNSNSRTIEKQKKQDSEFSSEFKKLTPSAAAGGKLVSQRGSFLERAGERAVVVLDTIGSSMMPKLNSNKGFGSGFVPPRGNKISILAFEVANTITKGATLFQSLCEENIQSLKTEILQSQGIQQLVSTDTKLLITLIEADKREEFNVLCKEVARFGSMCKDPQWHNLNRYFSRLDLELGNKKLRVEAEKRMQELTTLAQSTAELYHELNAFDRFEQDYRLKVKEMESLNLPLQGDSLSLFQSELKHQRKLVKSLQKKSLWSKNLEEIVEKFVDIITYLHQAISEFLGNYGTSAANYSQSFQRLGEAGLALHYANIINQINMIASQPAVLPPNIRDTLYHGLPNSIKSALPHRLQNIDGTKEVSIAQVKAEMDKILQWLAPFATNTTKAYQGFGWVGEWAKGSNEFGGDNTAKESNMIRLQTLYYADKEKINFYILELLAHLHHVISFVRQRRNAKKPIPTRRSPTKGLHFQSKMLHFLSLNNSSKVLGSELSQEDRILLEEVVARRRRTPGISKSENLVLNKRRDSTRVWHCRSKSVGNSPIKEFFGTRKEMEHQNSLDVMDGLR